MIIQRPSSGYGYSVPPLLLAVKLPTFKWATAARMPSNFAAIIPCLRATRAENCYLATRLPGFREQGCRHRGRIRSASCFFVKNASFPRHCNAFQCARLATAGTLPLTGNDIVLMLRMGYSTENIVRDLNSKHFVGPLDPSSEAQIRQLNASPKLLDDLKSGRFDATTDQKTQAQQKIEAVNAEGARIQSETAALAAYLAQHRSGATVIASPTGVDESGAKSALDRFNEKRSKDFETSYGAPVNNGGTTYGPTFRATTVNGTTHTDLLVHNLNFNHSVSGCMLADCFVHVI
jgi:hypothetical protein